MNDLEPAQTYRSQFCVSSSLVEYAEENSYVRHLLSHNNERLPWMLIQDVINRILPPPHHGPTDHYRIQVRPSEDWAEEFVAAGLGRTHHWNHVDDTIWAFFQSCSHLLMLFGEISYEMVRVWHRRTSRVVGFQLVMVPPRSLFRKSDQLLQGVPRRIAARQSSPREVAIPSTRVLTFSAPEAVRDELPHMMERLAVLSSPVLPSHFFRPLDQAEWNFFDVNGYFSFHELALVHATRSIGWNGRAQFMGDAEKRMLEHYWLRRELMFERFIIEMRQSILDTLNQGLDRVGGHLRGGLRIEVEGLPSMADVDDALRRLMKGNMAFGEIMKPFRR